MHYLRDRLTSEFERARAGWRDQTAAKFQHDYLSPSLDILSAYVRAEEALVEAIDNAERVIANYRS